MQLVKIVVFIPVTYVDKLRIAIGNAGFGKIGNYSHCAFVSYGDGYFRPNTKAKPTIGSNNIINKVSEAKLEFICYKNEVNAVLTVIKDNHPYEEIAMDIMPLLN